jgi:hypothetical protein
MYLFVTRRSGETSLKKRIYPYPKASSEIAPGKWRGSARGTLNGQLDRKSRRALRSTN